MSQNPQSNIPPHPALTPGELHVGTKPDDVFNAELAAQMAKRTDKLVDNTIDIAVRLKQAREFMAWSATHIRQLWLEWQAESGKAANEMNMFRMAFERESRSVTAAAKDVTSFFNSHEYIEAHNRLDEMLRMLERFSAYKKDGTLDAFADFILKVSVK